MNERGRKRREELMGLAREMRDVWWCGTEPPDSLDGAESDRWAEVAGAMAACGLIGSKRLSCAMAAAAAATRLEEAVRYREGCEDVPGWVDPPKGIAAATAAPGGPTRRTRSWPSSSRRRRWHSGGPRWPWRPA